MKPSMLARGAQSEEATMETMYVLLAAVITLLALRHGEIAATHRR
jgi:hypothetical protein